MADLFHLTAPLTIRLKSGERRVMAEHFRHPHGLLYFDLYWDDDPPEQTIHVVEGAVSGDGPWRVGDCVVQVLGCHGTDPELADHYSRWRAHLVHHAYPPRPLIEAIARRYGALTG
jgi:hypothetical protein